MTNKETIDIFNQHLSGGKNMIMLKARSGIIFTLNMRELE